MNGLCGVGARSDCTTDLYAGELFEKVEVEPGASELAIGDAAHAGRFQLLHGLGDCLVLDSPTFLDRDRACSELLASIQDGLRTQEAADVIGSKWRVDRTHENDCR